MQTIVQDDTGATERLALYNTDASTNEEELLPKNAIFAVKEPYYTATAEGSCSLRIDHPSDLLYLNPLDPQVPRGIRADLAELNKSALDWKNMGNIAYSAGRYLPALHAYSRGLDACGSDDMTLKRDLLRNRAVVNLFLKRFRQASEDAKPALIPANGHRDDRATALNSKAYERAAHMNAQLMRLTSSAVTRKPNSTSKRCKSWRQPMKTFSASLSGPNNAFENRLRATTTS